MTGLCERKPRYARCGTTLAELLVSLTITSLIALSIASMLFAASYGTSSKRDMRRLMVQTERVRFRLNDAIRSARAVLSPAAGASASYIVLWQADTSGDDQINLSELRLIELPAGSSTLSSYVAGEDLGSDPAYTAETDFHATATAARDAGDLVGTAWSDNAGDLTITPSESNTGDKPLVQWRLTLTNELLAETLVDGVALRSAAASK